MHTIFTAIYKINNESRVCADRSKKNSAEFILKQLRFKKNNLCSRARMNLHFIIHYYFNLYRILRSNLMQFFAFVYPQEEINSPPSSPGSFEFFNLVSAEIGGKILSRRAEQERLSRAREESRGGRERENCV